MIPVFCAEVFTQQTTATFTVTDVDTGTPYNFSWNVPAGLYWMGRAAHPANPNIVDALVDQIQLAVPGSTWSIIVNFTSLNIGASIEIVGAGLSPTERWTLTANNAAAKHVLWSCGFRDTTTVTSGTSESAFTNGIPYGTWWPKARNTITERWTPVEVQAYSSPLPGAGSALASVRQEPTTQGRWWRTWRILPIDAARCSVRRAVSTTTPQWAAIAGLTSNPGDAALDNPDWWWSRTLDGSRRFIAIEDESALISGTVRWGEYRFAIGEREQPVAMDQWRKLGNVTQYGPAGSTQQLEICALWTGAGNL